MSAKKTSNGWPVPKCLYRRKMPAQGGATTHLAIWRGVAFERHQFQLGKMWPSGGSYMTAANAENRTRAWAKSEDSQEGSRKVKLPGKLRHFVLKMLNSFPEKDKMYYWLKNS